MKLLESFLNSRLSYRIETIGFTSLLICHFISQLVDWGDQ